MTQTEMVHEMLKMGSITQADAIREIGCYRLAARIKDLKDQGVTIDRDIVTSVSRFGKPVHHARYFLIPDHAISH